MNHEKKPESTLLTTCPKCHQAIELDVTTLLKSISDAFKITAEKLVCFGCAHAAANQPYPGKPSGERPCGICKRNPEGQQANFIMSNNNVQIYGPKDMYWSTDRFQLELAGLHTHHPWLSADVEKVRYAEKKKSQT